MTFRFSLYEHIKYKAKVSTINTFLYIYIIYYKQFNLILYKYQK
jgi:hypothetical protein